MIDTTIYVIEVQDKFSEAFASFSVSLEGIATTAVNVFAKLSEVAYEGLADAVRAFSSFEDRMIVVRRTTGETGEFISQLGDQIRQMAIETLNGGIAVNTLAEIAGVAGQLGIRGTQDILAFTETIAKMTVATDLTANAAAVALPKILKAWNLPIAENVKALGSVINQLGNETNATQSQITNAMKRMAGTAAIFGMSIDQVAALAATMVAAGADVGVGSTAMIQMMQKIRTESDKWASALEIDAARLKSALIHDPVYALQIVFEAFKAIQESQGPVVAAERLKELGLTGARVADTFQKLSLSVKDYSGNLELAAVELQKADSLDREFAIAMDKLSSAFEGVRTRITEILLLIGEPLATALKQLIQTDLNPLLDQFTAWLRSSYFLEEVWPRFIHTLKIEIIRLKVIMVEWIQYLWENWPTLYEEIRIKARKAWQILQQGIATLTAIVVYIRDHWKPAFESLKSIITTIQIVWDTLIGSIETARTITQPFFDNLVEVFYGLEYAIEAVSSVMDSFISKVGSAISKVLEFGKVAYGFSVFPETLGWIERNTKEMGNLEQAIVQTSQTMQSLTFANAATDGTVDITGQIMRGNWATRGAGAFAQAYTSKQPVTNTSLSQSASVTVNFNGMNIVDDYSMENAVKKITEVQTRLGGRIIA